MSTPEESVTQDSGAPKNLWERFTSLPTESMSNTLIVTITLCLFCSMVVSGFAVALRPIQEANKLEDKRKNILQVAGLYEEGKDVDETFKSVEPRIVDLKTGKFTEAVDVNTYEQRAAAKDPAQSVALDADPAGIRRQAKYASVYIIRDGAGDIDKIILPVHGYGLWSTLYGFVALERDANQVAALQFYEHAETPGLGAEVDNPKWRASWTGKKIYGSDGKVKLAIAKGVPAKDNVDYHIDALAGATLTTRGVDNLIQFWMGEQGFKPFLDNLKKGAA
ncbi:MAG: Na(+)-translocating NADH-quinone reductase subunit C [Gammaproteobacteria bacterium]|nr:Na(+)-translocating NADH-quinone reductase subunit C [Gammaproteobacteria bacterium]